MGSPARKPATYDDLFDLPEHWIGEILGGELYASPIPAPLQARASSFLGADLGGPFMRGRGGPGGWWIIDKPELHLGEDILVPDLAGWRRERMPEFPQGAFFTLPPDWVCEILSPSTARRDRGIKLPIYAREGVKNVWLLDPIARTLEILRLQEGRWVILAVHTGSETIQAEPFEAVALELEPLWGEEKEEEVPMRRGPEKGE